MNARPRTRAAVACGLLALLTACGGGTDTTAANDTMQQSSFAAAYISGLSALNTPAGLTSTSFQDLFDDTFLDAGYTKQQVKDSLTAEATALAVAPDLSQFPAVNLSDVVISNCNASDVCTLSATLTNSDVDTTTTTFTTQVKYSNGKYHLYGDQLGA